MRGGRSTIEERVASREAEKRCMSLAEKRPMSTAEKVIGVLQKTGGSNSGEWE
jgi:hypothetical protein